MNEAGACAAKIRSFRDLEIWKRGISLVEAVYKATEDFPRQEAFGLTGQIRRAAVSIPSNVAEGFARYHGKEYTQFLYIAMGSCAELSTQLDIALRLGYLDAKRSVALLDEVEQISKMTMGLVKKLKARD